MDTITAAKAREITEANLKGPCIESFVSTLSVKIGMLAKEGKRELIADMYLSSLRGTQPTRAEWIALRQHFVLQGFDFQEYPDPDPGHPASRPYILIGW